MRSRDQMKKKIFLPGTHLKLIQEQTKSIRNQRQRSLLTINKIIHTFKAHKKFHLEAYLKIDPRYKTKNSDKGGLSDIQEDVVETLS